MSALTHTRREELSVTQLGFLRGNLVKEVADVCHWFVLSRQCSFQLPTVGKFNELSEVLMQGFLTTDAHR